VTDPDPGDAFARLGDSGCTGLPDRSTVWKDHPRLEVCGTLDELNSLLGVVRAENLPEPIDRLLERIQHELLAAGAQVAAGDSAGQEPAAIDAGHVRALDRALSECEEGLPRLGGFILPGGTRAAALVHLARAVCRRAERRLVSLIHDQQSEKAPHLVAYLNRLSNLLFVVARHLNAQAGRGETLWEKTGSGSARNHPAGRSGAPGETPAG